MTTETIYKYHIQVEEDDNLSTDVDINEERKLSSDTFQINYSDPTSEISSEEQIIQTETNPEALIDLK